MIKPKIKENFQFSITKPTLTLLEQWTLADFGSGVRQRKQWIV
jgi:hypothetical protein